METFAEEIRRIQTDGRMYNNAMAQDMVQTSQADDQAIALFIAAVRARVRAKLYDDPAATRVCMVHTGALCTNPDLQSMAITMLADPAYGLTVTRRHDIAELQPQEAMVVEISWPPLTPASPRAADMDTSRVYDDTDTRERMVSYATRMRRLAGFRRGDYNIRRVEDEIPDFIQQECERRVRHIKKTIKARISDGYKIRSARFRIDTTAYGPLLPNLVIAALRDPGNGFRVTPSYDDDHDSIILSVSLK